MSVRKLRLPMTMFAVLVLSTGAVWALGFELGETKEELQLDYDVSVVDHGTGRVTVTLTLADEGRLAPLSGVYLNIPNDETDDGSGPVDLSVALDTREEDGKEVVRVHILRELAERGEIQLQTYHLDGKQEPLTWYYHVIPFADYLDDEEPTED